MDRREFIKTTGTLIAGATIAPESFAASQNTLREDGSARRVLPINRGWLYSRTADDAATARDFNDSTFERVVVPHTNTQLPWHSFSEYEYTFVSTYRRQFKLPAAAKGRRVFVDSEGGDDWRPPSG